MTPVLPGATIGIFGGGQLGRMMTLAARVLGYHVIILDPDPGCANGYARLADVRYDARDVQWLAGLLTDAGLVAPTRIGVAGHRVGGAGAGGASRADPLRRPGLHRPQ